MAGKPYQLASDGFWGNAYSGVIKSDGTWVPCAADNEDWEDYMDWYAEKVDPPNRADPFLSPADGGVTIKLKEGEVAVGSMLDSLPPPQNPAPQAAPAPAPAHAAPAPAQHSASQSASQKK